MKILHITPSYKPAYIYGGPIYSVSALCEAHNRQGHQVDVLTTKANGTAELSVISHKPYTVDGVDVFYFSRQTKDHTHFSLGLFLYLWKHGKNYQVIHIHSWWNWVAIFSVCICKLRGFKFILSPRGMFSEYSQHKNKNILKKWVHNLLNKPVLSYVIFHATTPAEAKRLYELFPKANVHTLFNLVTLPDFPVERKTHNDIYRICFLSRIDPKKGLELLFRAVKKMDIPFELTIIGTGEEPYINELKDLSKSLDIEYNIQWKGQVIGDEKYKYLADADLLVLTSYNENFANVVIESLSVGTPVLISQEVGLSDYIEEHKLGWVCALSMDSIVETLRESYFAKEQRSKINDEAPLIVQKHFSSSVLADGYLSVYKDILKHA